jgi:hypothetical protein
MPVKPFVSVGKLRVRSSAPVRLPAQNPAQSTATADSTGRGPLKQILQLSEGGFLAYTALFLKIAKTIDPASKS